VGPVDDRLSSLTKVKGFGERRAGQLMAGIGGREALIEVLEKGDVSRLSSVQNISGRMAVELITAYRGEDPSTLLRTDGVRDIYESIVERIRSYMMTGEGRNRTSLLLPCGDLGEREREAIERYALLEMLEGVDREEVSSCLASIGRVGKSGRRNRKLDYILIVESERAYDKLRAAGLDRRCLVLSPEEVEQNLEGTLILVYDSREIDESFLPIAASVGCDSPPERIVPEVILDLYGGRREQLRALSRLEEIFGREPAASGVLSELEAFEALAAEEDPKEDPRRIIEGIRSEIEDSLRSRIEEITLSGTDALSLLASGESPVLRDIFREHSRMAAEIVRKRLGQKRDLFVMGYPVTVDEEAFERMLTEMEEEGRRDRFLRKQELASRLAAGWEKVKGSIDWALDLDFRFGLACFIRDMELHPFRIVEGWFGMHDACHLQLRSQEDRQLVDYHLGEVPPHYGSLFPFNRVSSSRTAVLTGANSGGKTTLLETICQIVIMARMGLPVPAEQAFVPEIDDLYLYRPRRRLDAGGLEGFLKELLPLAVKVDERTMVLADELEAMTELDAASRILGVFIDEISRRGAFSVVVTHMSDEITRYTRCRIDGIEAKGLDENYELIVDRTPLIGKQARSTPELILRKLKGKSRGGEREIYSRVLERFDTG